MKLSINKPRIKYIFLILALLCLVGIYKVTQNPVSETDENISIARFGTSSVGSTFYVIANGLGNLMQKHAGINMTVEPIGGSYANIFSLKAGKIDFAITNSGAAYDGYYGVAPFEGQVNVRLVAQGQASYRFLLLRRDENISTLEGLKGKIIIGKRPALPELFAITTALSNAANITGINIVSTKNTKESLRHIKSGTVDGVIIPGGARVPAVVQLFRDGVVDPVYIPRELINKMKQELPPYLFTHTFPPNHFDGQNNEYTVFGLNTYLLAGPDALEEQVYTITKTIFENSKEFHSYHNAARQWTLENSLKDPKIPFHDGAIRYYEEIGLWSDEMKTLQEKLLAANQ